MSALPVARYLKELSGDGSRRSERLFAPPGVEEAADIELRISEAHARGVAEGRAAAEAEFAVAAAAQVAGFEEKLTAERARWAEEQGATLGERCASALDEMEQRLSHTVGELLKPVLSESVRSRALEELTAVLHGMLSKGEYAKVVVSGPSDLLGAMETRLAGSHSGMSFVPSDGTDVSVSVDETILETRIGAWIGTITGENQ